MVRDKFAAAGDRDCQAREPDCINQIVVFVAGHILPRPSRPTASGPLPGLCREWQGARRVACKDSPMEAWLLRGGRSARESPTAALLTQT